MGEPSLESVLLSEEFILVSFTLENKSFTVSTYTNKSCMLKWTIVWHGTTADCVRRVCPWYWGVVQIVLEECVHGTGGVVQIVLEECVHGTGVLYRLC